MNKVTVPINEAWRDGHWHEYSCTVNDRHVSIMFRFVQGHWQAFLNACPHQGRRMDFAPDQFLVGPDGTIVCPAHGAEFRPDNGFCVNGPCRGASLQAVTVDEHGRSGSLVFGWGLHA